MPKAGLIGFGVRIGWAPISTVWLPLVLACGIGDRQDSASIASELEGARGTTVLRHPIPDSLLSNRTDVPVHDLEFGKLPSAGRPALVALSRFPEVRAVGSLDGKSGPTLGEIADAVVIPSGVGFRVAVLDRSYGLVRVFDSDGTLHSQVGGFGGGPGEFKSPLAVAHGDGAVIVLDAARKTERFRRVGRTWEPVGRLSVPADAQDLCSMEDGLLILGMAAADQAPGGVTDGMTVHTVSNDERIQASFSRPYRYSGAGPVYSLTRGSLACDRRRGLVWVAYSTLHEVHALDQYGNLRWIVRLPDQSYPDILERPGGRFGEDPEQRTRADRITHVSLLDDSLLAVQITSRRFGDRGGQHTDSYRTYLLDANTGIGLGAFEGDHQVIGGGGGYAVVYREMPFPQFGIVAVPEVE